MCIFSCLLIICYSLSTELFLWSYWKWFISYITNIYWKFPERYENISRIFEVYFKNRNLGRRELYNLITLKQEKYKNPQDCIQQFLSKKKNEFWNWSLSYFSQKNNTMCKDMSVWQNVSCLETGVMYCWKIIYVSGG